MVDFLCKLDGSSIRTAVIHTHEVAQGIEKHIPASALLNHLFAIEKQQVTIQRPHNEAVFILFPHLRWCYAGHELLEAACTQLRHKIGDRHGQVFAPTTHDIGRVWLTISSCRTK